MKKWTKPQVITIYEKELQNCIIAGACSDHCEGGNAFSPIKKSLNSSNTQNATAQ